MESLEVEAGGAAYGNLRLQAQRRSLVSSAEAESISKKPKTTASYVFGALAALLSIGLMIGFIYTVFDYSDDEIVCKTNTCKLWAEKTQKKMNFSINPCEDFYEYACGGWIQSRGLELESVGYKAEDSTQRRLETRVLETLRELLEPDNGLRFRQVSGMIPKVFDFYAACMNVQNIEDKGGKRLIKVLAKVSMEESDDDYKNRQNFADQLARLSRWGMGSLVALDIWPDLKDSSVHRVYASQSTLMLPQQNDYRGKDPMTDEPLHHLLNYIRKLMTLSAMDLQGTPKISTELTEPPEDGHNLRNYLNNLTDDQGQFSDVFDARITARALEVVKFEQRIAEIMVSEDRVMLAREEYNLRSVADLRNEDKERFDWDTLLNGFLQANASAAGVDKICIRMLEYFSKLGDVLKSTKFEVLADYLRVRVLYFSVGRLSEAYRNATREFEHQIHGTTKETPRWKTCARHTNDALGFALGSAFIAKNWTGRSTEAATMIIKETMNSFRKSIDRIAWMNPQAKQNAHNNLDKLLPTLGQPDTLKNTRCLERYYKSLNVSSDDYFGNAIRASYFEWTIARRYLFNESLREMYGKHWQIAPATPISYYSRSRNVLTVTAGILQPPFFHTTMPGYLNFGGIGTIMAHELMHGFDKVGSKYDPGGSMKLDWDEDVKTNYTKNEECFINQFSNFSVTVGEDTIPVNGKQTAAENVIDTAGLKYAYRAYLEFLKNYNNDEDEPPLAELGLTSRQLFFVSFAITHCYIARPEQMRTRLYKDYHAPHRYRVLGALQNSEEFAEVFKCPKGSAMNPVDKCFLF